MRISKKDVVAVLIFVALIVGFILLINNITGKSNSREKEIVAEAVKNAALTCYAVEGMYPEDISYLRDNYNLSFNEDKYVVDYTIFASNVIPHIKVIEKGDTSLE